MSDAVDNDYGESSSRREASQAFDSPSVSGSRYGRQDPYTSSQGSDTQGNDSWAGAARYGASDDYYYEEDAAYTGSAQWGDGARWDSGATWESERWARRSENAPDDTMKWLGGTMAVAAVVLVAGNWIAEHPVVLLPPLFLFFFTPLGERLASPPQSSMGYTSPDNEYWNVRDNLSDTAPNSSASSKPETDSWGAPAADDPELPAYKSPANQAWAAAQLAARRASERAAAQLNALDEEIGYRGGAFWREKSTWASDAYNTAFNSRESGAVVGNADSAAPRQTASGGARGEEPGFGRPFSQPAGAAAPSRSPAVAPVSALSVSASALYLPASGAADASAGSKAEVPEQQQAAVEVVEPEEIIAPNDFSARRRGQPAASRWQVLKQRQQSQGVGSNAGRYRHWKRSQRAQANATAAGSANEYSTQRGVAVRPVRQRVTAAQMARGGAIQRADSWWSGSIVQNVWGDPATRARYINTVRATRQPVVNALLKLFPWLRSWGGLL